MSWLLANSIAAAALSVLVLLIARWWKPAPAVMHGLWLVVVLKLVTPPLFEVPLNLSWLPSMTNTANAELAPQRLGPALPSAPSAIAATTAPLTQPTAAVASDAVTLHTPTATAAASSSAWLWAWLASSSLLLIATTRRTLRIHKTKRSFGPVPIQLRLEVRELAERIGVVVPQLCDDPQTAAPYIWTIGRTRLVLPVELLKSCSKKGREAVIAHELAHLHRKDHWIARCELVLLTLIWWHPLFWFARSRMRLWAELACDAIAVNTVPNANLDYATLLVDAAAQPLPTPPGVAVLASRPAARAAFERRLKMILNENLPRRASRAWCVPFAALALGLFAVPVAAQEQDPDPVRVEIRVNGKTVKNLTAMQREALLEVLLDENKPTKQEKRRIRVRNLNRGDQKPQAGKASKKLERRITRTKKIAGLPNASELQGALQEGLAEARREIKNDKDLQELGITDEVLALIDGIANGEGIESSLDGVVRAAMKGAGKMVIKEISDDEDLRGLGLDKGIAKLVTGLLENEANLEILGELARTALGSALEEAKMEIRNDKDLQQLGIADDVEGLIASILSGDRDVDADLNKVIEKAVQADVERETKGSKKTERRIRIKSKGKNAKEKRRKRETIR
ncbi:MAG: bla regulator protein BlaR1 [Planctomycetota bacterium]|jgi:bla regulator protein BlaR1